MPADLGTVAEQLRRLTVHVRDGGAGVIWRPDGLIITNAHVARSYRQRIELFDGRVLDATVTRRDVRRDLALLRADFNNASAVRVRDSNELKSGELAIAIGHPLGFLGALSTGVIHGQGPIAGWTGCRGCKPIFVWRREIPADRWPTRKDAWWESTP